ncbi:hypothetical protein SAMN05216354_0888 [Xylanibacter ruminicola]|uniref:Uncharacterized protein n=1 Tax=Xylanibacter ruminicola TaxID=839 RepID=A0A1H5T880_XYLRU|nr:hypothetical protein [Xylanibacter ruminicola]SEF58187.1 hypothetical protein SAMN05216354_0888 [Xylanibacter ruminicola]
MDNQNNNLQELEGLRDQVTEFKKRMEQQEIVNHQLLKIAMNKHISWIKFMNTWTGPIALVLSPLFIFCLRELGCSWIPIIFIILVLIGETVFNIWNVSTISNKHLAAQDIISVQQRLTAYKRREKLQTYIECPLILLLGGWFIFDIYNYINIPVIKLIVGLLLGSFIIFFILFREIRSLNKAIKVIDEFNIS